MSWSNLYPKLQNGVIQNSRILPRETRSHRTRLRRTTSFMRSRATGLLTVITVISEENPVVARASEEGRIGNGSQSRPIFFRLVSEVVVLSELNMTSIVAQCDDLH